MVQNLNLIYFFLLMIIFMFAYGLFNLKAYIQESICDVKRSIAHETNRKISEVSKIAKAASIKANEALTMGSTGITTTANPSTPTFPMKSQGIDVSLYGNNPGLILGPIAGVATYYYELKVDITDDAQYSNYNSYFYIDVGKNCTRMLNYDLEYQAADDLNGMEKITQYKVIHIEEGVFKVQFLSNIPNGQMFLSLMGQFA